MQVFDRPPPDNSGFGDPPLFLAKVTAVSGTGASATYGISEQQVTSAGTTEDRVSGRAGSATINLARFPGGGTLAVDDLVLARRSVRDANEYEILALIVGTDSGSGGSEGWTTRGKLDGALSFGGSATMSVWWWNGSAEADTTVNVTVYDWLLVSGQSIASGTQVTAAWDARSGRYYVTGAQCA